MCDTDAGAKLYLDTSFDDNDYIKKYGARFDGARKKWYVCMYTKKTSVHQAVLNYHCDCVFRSLPFCDYAQRCHTYHRYVQEDSQHLDKLKEFLPSFDGTKESVESSLPLFTLYLILHCASATFFSV